MKPYTITKVVYANSLNDALLREREGVIIYATLQGEFSEEEYKELRKNKLKLRNIIDHEQETKSRNNRTNN